jgi:hypothetical protein
MLDRKAATSAGDPAQRVEELEEIGDEGGGMLRVGVVGHLFFRERWARRKKPLLARAKRLALDFRAIFFSAFGTLGFESLLVGSNHKKWRQRLFRCAVITG